MTTNLGQWTNRFNTDNQYKAQDEEPSPRMRAKAQASVRKRNSAKQGHAKHGGFSSSERPVNIKNAEGTTTDSFYYVENENTDRLFGNINEETTALSPELISSNHVKAQNRSETSTHRLEPDLSWGRSFPGQRTYESVRLSPKMRAQDRRSPKTGHTAYVSDDTRHHSDASNSHVDDMQTLTVAKHDKLLIPLSDNVQLLTPDDICASPYSSHRSVKNHRHFLPVDRVTASPRYRGLHILSIRKGRHKPALPKRVLDEVGATNRPEIQNALDLMREGETLLMVEHTRWVSRTVNTECQLKTDYMHVSYVRRRCWMPNMRCGRLNDTFDIRGVMMARSGRDGLLRVIETDVPETRCFSIVFANDSRKALSFLAQSEQSAKYWVNGINFIKKKLNKLLPRSKRELYLWEIFKASDASGDDKVGYFEILELFRKMGAVTSKEKKEELKKIFLNHASPESNLLSFEQFIDFFQETTLRPEIERIFHKYSADKIYVTAREIYKFMQESQCEYDVTEDDCLQIIEDYEINEERRTNKQMTVYGFVNFIKSPACDVFNRRHDEVYQDMKRPLACYFIASSHNTYLTGDQLKDSSSTDAYMKALLQGCRCVELDCWDGPDGDPVIFHGYTLTSKIKFKHAIEVIGKHAFKASNYPLILSIENHCSVPQQEKMAEYMKRIFGSELLTECLISENEELHLPCPAALQGKILIKGKKLPPSHFHDESSDSSDDDVSDEDEAAEMEKVIHENNDKRKRGLPRVQFFQKKRSTTSIRDTIRGEHFDEENSKQLFKTDGVKGRSRSSAAMSSLSNHSSTRTQEAQEKKFKLSKSLSDQVVYCQSKKFKGIEESQNPSFRQISSFTENKAFRLATQKTQEAIKLHKQHLNRTYPGATRTDSSNYDPQPLWNAGFQIVALNYQTRCDKMAVYDAKFRQNGRCGYILKPKFMTSANRDEIKEQSKRMNVTVISGSYLPVKETSEDSVFYVEMSITGDPKDVARKKTTPATNKGYNPVWGEEIFFDIQVPSLAMVWFRVLNADLAVVGQFVLPFTSVSQGYRTVQLSSNSGTLIKNAYLLVHISVNNIS